MKKDVKNGKIKSPKLKLALGILSSVLFVLSIYFFFDIILIAIRIKDGTDWDIIFRAAWFVVGLTSSALLNRD